MGDLTKARILIFTGDGKGKTTAALGLALRACGHGMGVLVVQFVKQQGCTGEVAAVEALPLIEIIQTGFGFITPAESDSFAKHKAAAQAGLDRANEAISAGQWDVVVLDEICAAVAEGLLAEADVMETVRKAPPEITLVLTGRGATQGLIDMADTVTEMRCVKHALQSGRTAQKGVEL